MAFEIGVDACVVVRTGSFSFDVFPAAGGGRHVLELVSYPDTNGTEYYYAFLDGECFETSGVLGLWDLLTEVVVGGSWVYNQEDV